MTSTATPHDAQQLAGWLRQALSQDKRPIGLLLGAGCPCAIPAGSGAPGTAPLIPAVSALTELVSHKVCAGSCKDNYEKIVSHLTADGATNPDVEKVLTYIRGLRSVAGDTSEVRGLTAEALKILDETICSEIVAAVDQSLPEADTPYDQVAAWIRSTARAIPVEIFTTNYDLLMEQALERQRVPYFDGFVGACSPFFEPQAMDDDALPQRWTRLWKLHGSVNWTMNHTGKAVTRASRLKGRVAVIHPSHLKYEESRRMPYLAMQDRLKRFLLQPSAVLVVSGYSFGDQHINELLVDTLHANPTGVVFGTFRGELNRPAAVELATETPNLSLLGRGEAIIGGRRASWTEIASAESFLTSAAIDWIAVDKANADSPRRAEFRLGSFARMGDFFAEIVGDASKRGLGV